MYMFKNVMKMIHCRCIAALQEFGDDLMVKTRATAAGGGPALKLSRSGSVIRRPLRCPPLRPQRQTGVTQKLACKHIHLACIVKLDLLGEPVLVLPDQAHGDMPDAELDGEPGAPPALQLPLVTPSAATTGRRVVTRTPGGDAGGRE